jgi:NAD+ diphosphatase
MVNSSGQTACDIAEFWLHENVVVELRAAAVAHETSSVTLPGVQTTRVSNYFTESPLDRMSHKRTNTEWLCEMSQMESTVYILFINLNVVAAQYEQAMPNYSKSVYRAVRFKHSQIKSWLNVPNNPATVVFLGVENPPGSKAPHSDINIGWFAVDVTNATTIEYIQQTVCPQAELISIHPRLLSMPRAEAAIIGQGRSMLAWHDRYQFCPTCGNRTELQEAGYKRKCTKESCRSQTG